MENPLEQKAPEDPIERVHVFARDLAYGVSIGKWETRFTGLTVGGRTRWMAVTEHVGGQANPFLEYIRSKWDEKSPSGNLMQTLGYFQFVETKQGGSREYLLTEKCFELLQKPASEPKVFISYRRGHSTGLALYLEARLRLTGNHSVFVDKALEPGSQWRDELEAKIRESKYFVVVCTHGTFDSDWVMKEIDIAIDAGCTMISVLHPVDRELFSRGSLPEILSDREPIKIHNAEAAQYEVAANKLLSYMGYATY